MSKSIDIQKVHDTYSSPSLASRPNKVDMTADMQTFDLFQKIKQAALESQQSELKNLSEPSTMFVVNTTQSWTADLMYGVKSHADQDYTSDVNNRPTQVTNTHKYFAVLVHYGFLVNGPGIMIDKQSNHLQFFKAYEFVADVERHQNQYQRSGDTCSVRFHVDDCTVCIVTGWKGNPPKGRNTNFKEIMTDWYKGAKNNYKQPGALKPPKPPRKGKKRRGTGGNGGNNRPTYPPGSGGPAASVDEVDCNDRSTWKPKNPVRSKKWSRTAGLNVQSTFNPAAAINDSKVLDLYEVYADRNGKTMQWGNYWKRRKPAGLPRAAHPVLSQRSSLHIYNHYVNQLTEISDQYHWWIKAAVLGLFRKESAFLMGIPAMNFDCRGKADNDYCKQSVEKGEGNWRGHFIEDGPRHPGSKFISAVGFHGANYAAWKLWLKTIGRAREEHVCLQTIKDECQVGVLYYWKIIFSKWVNNNPGKVMTQSVIESLIAVCAIWHAGQAYGYKAISRSNQLRDLSGLTIDPARPQQSAGAIIRNIADNIDNPPYKPAKIYATIAGRIKAFREIVSNSTPGGDMFVRLDPNLNPPPSPKFETNKKSRRYVKLPARK